MRLDRLNQIKVPKRRIIFSLRIKILYLTEFVTSVTVREPRSYGVGQIKRYISAALASVPSVRLGKLRILLWCVFRWKIV